MKLFYGLVLAFYFFDGFIIQCNGKNIKSPFLPDELFGEIFAKAGLEKTKEVAQAQIRAAGYAIRRIFETHRIVISNLVYDIQPAMTETIRGDLKFLIIKSYTKLMSLFKQFGNQARSIYIRYDLMDKNWRREINEKIINRYAHQLTELCIWTQEDDTEIWAEISNGRRDARFSNLERLHWIGVMKRKKFDLNAIFPSLKSLTLLCCIADWNCMANVTNLQDFCVNIQSIQDHHHLEKILRNNQQISTLKLTTVVGNTIEKQIFRLLENKENLKTLKINRMRPDFLNRASDRVYNLTSITSFSAKFTSLIVSNGNFSFEMPNLKDLELLGVHIDNRISDFINHFKTLETVIVNGEQSYNFTECIDQLKYVKEFTTSNIIQSQFSSLEQCSEKFDATKSNLKKLVFYVRDTDYNFYETEIHAINNKLRIQKKPTWMSSHGNSDAENNTCKINLSLEMNG